MKYRIIDTHCHPQFPQYDADRDAVVRRALDAGIGMICVGTDLEKSREAIALANEYEGLYASVGLHPNDNLGELYDESAYEVLARDPKVVAIGEVGLDYFRTTDDQLKSVQKERFLRQVQLAYRVAKPLIIHCRDAHDDMIEILKVQQTAGKQLRGVIHSFNSSVADARAYIDGGFYIGLNAIVSFSKAYDEMVRYIPMDRLLLETDAPYLAPQPYRGKRNEPSYIEAVGNHIAMVRDNSVQELFSATRINATSLFGIRE